SCTRRPPASRSSRRSSRSRPRRRPGERTARAAMTGRRGGSVPSSSAASALLCSLIAFQSAAETRAPFPKVDPYTGGAAEALSRAAYVSFGPFLGGDNHSTAQIRHELGGTPLIFVETAHFKLGSSLPEYELTKDAAENAKLRDELER